MSKSSKRAAFLSPASIIGTSIDAAMKLLRLLLLLSSYAAAVLALALLHSLTFDPLLPDRLLASAPSLALFNRWLPADVRTTAVAAALAALTGFGLAVPVQRAATAPPLRAGGQSLPATPFTLFLILSSAVAFLLLAGRQWLPLDGRLLFLLWLVWIVLLILLATMLDGGHRPRPPEQSTPESSWPWLLPLLLLAGLLFTWRSSTLPAAYPPFGFAVGIQAQEQAAALAAGPFAPGSAGIPALASLLTAATHILWSNPFTASATAGGLIGVAVVAATWLLACELFRRPQLIEDGEIVRDDGRMPALLAALTLAGLLPMLHVARLPWMLESVLWGTLGLWALLRALRTGSVRVLVLGSTALGLAALWSPNGWVVAAVATIVLSVAALLRPQWVRASQGGIGLRGALTGGAALAVTLALGLCLGGCAVSLSGGSLDTVLTLLRGSIDALPTPAHTLAIGLLPATLLLLAVGGLLFQPGQLTTWLLLPWLVLGVLSAAGHIQPTAAWAVDWPAFALLLPVVALAAAFTLDRTRAALALTLGAWSRRAAHTLAVGLLLVAGLVAWKEYSHAAGRATIETAAARIIAALPDERPVTLLDDGSGLTWDAAGLRYALAGSHRSTGYLLPGGIAAWKFQPGEIVLVPPRLRDALPLLLAYTPDARITTERDTFANPTLYQLCVPMNAQW